MREKQTIHSTFKKLVSTISPLSVRGILKISSFTSISTGKLLIVVGTVSTVSNVVLPLLLIVVGTVSTVSNIVVKN